MKKTEDRGQRVEDGSQKTEVRGQNKKSLFSVFCFLFSVFCLLSSVMVSSVEALKISDFYQDVKVGQWILMKSSDGLLTKTSVIAKGDGKITLGLKSFKGKKMKVVSDSEEVIDVKKGQVVSLRIHEGDRVKEIFPDQTEMDEFFQINFNLIGEGAVTMDQKHFECKRYKGVYNDRVVLAWLSDEVPILHLVKIRMQGVSVKLVDYGK
ncbi:MAG: hypothetical protein HYS07_04125 [Chlamydiae bacterium]|nr:hypothetical protein [Chlamydiota bacterium]MBI3277386.1 hypothetical protein [Chlamydiota bacterium]